MKISGYIKFVMLGVCFIFPSGLASKICKRIERSYRAMNSSRELQLFWIVVTFPIKLILSFLYSLFKCMIIWMLPEKVYFDLIYVFHQFCNDLWPRNIGIKKATIRAKLCWELFTKGAEKRISCGSLNQDKIFLVIRPYYFLAPNEFIYNNIANLLTQYYYCLQKISYAVENGWIPVVDWQNYGKLAHAEDFPVNGTMNSWEYYWKQPSNFTLDEVYNSKNVILSTQNIGQYGYIPNASMAPPYNEYAENLAKKCPKYDANIVFNDITAKYIDEAYNNLFPQGKKVLGVVLRGAAYGRHGTPLNSHPMQISLNELMDETKKYLKEWDMEYIFFVNEMQELVEQMQKAFGDKLIVLPRQRDHIDRPTDGVTKNPLYADGCKYKTNLDYLTEVALLSRCDALIGSMSSGARTAIIWNAGKYENVNIFDKGLW